MTSVKKRRVCDLSHIKLPSSALDKNRPESKTRAWDGGKIITNKAEALRKFLARKKMTNLTEEQKKVVELAMRKNKEDTVFVKDFVKMKKDSSPKNVNSLLKASSKKIKQGKNNKNKKRSRGQSRQERNSLKKKRKHNKKDDKVKKKNKKKRSDSMSLLNGALTSRRGDKPQKKKRSDSMSLLNGALSSRR